MSVYVQKQASSVQALVSLFTSRMWDAASAHVRKRRFSCWSDWCVFTQEEVDS